MNITPRYHNQIATDRKDRWVEVAQNGDKLSGAKNRGFSDLQIIKELNNVSRLKLERLADHHLHPNIFVGHGGVDADYDAFGSHRWVAHPSSEKMLHQSFVKHARGGAGSGVQNSGLTLTLI